METFLPNLGDWGLSPLARHQVLLKQLYKKLKLTFSFTVRLDGMYSRPGLGRRFPPGRYMVEKFTRLYYLAGKYFF